jgi:hypothetical protein
MTRYIATLICALLVANSSSDHFSTTELNRPEIKIFRWVDVDDGKCSRTGATLELRPNGVARFQAQLTTSSSNEVYWSSILHLGPGPLGNGGFDSRRFQAAQDGSSNTIDFSYEFRFSPERFKDVSYAVENSGCK